MARSDASDSLGGSDVPRPGPGRVKQPPGRRGAGASASTTVAGERLVELADETETRLQLVRAWLAGYAQAVEDFDAYAAGGRAQAQQRQEQSTE